MDGESEAALVRRAASGETEAFQKLFEAHHRAMFRFAYRLTSAVDAAEDITHECFVRLVDGSTFDQQRGSLRQFLYGTVRNLARQRQHANGREAQWDETVANGPKSAAAPYADTEDSKQLAAAVQDAIAALSPLQREAIVLCEFEELSLEQASAIVETDLGTLKSRLYRAREGLRRSLAPYRSCVQTTLPGGTTNESIE